MFGLSDDLRHHGDGFNGILAGGAFAREHDGVSAVIDGVGDVGGLGTSWPWVVDHRFEHLRGSNNGFAVLGCPANDVLLERGNFFGGKLDAEIAAGHHDSVGDLEDAVKMLDRLWLFELRNHPCVGFKRSEAVLDVTDVSGSAHEGDGDDVYSLTDGKDEVFLVLFRERWDIYGDSRQIDALVFAEHAAVDDLAGDVGAFNLLDTQLNQTVGEKNAGSGLEILGEGLEGGADQSGGTFHLARSDGKAFAGDELDGLVVLKLGGTDLGTLQIGENADGLAFLPGDSADHTNEFGLLRVC